MELTTALTTPRSRRGRPLRLPTDRAPRTGLVVDSRPRLSWLLALSRLHSGRPEHLNREAFGRALVQVGVNADQSRISRWESGSMQLPGRAFFGYECVLGTPAGGYELLADQVRRSLDPDAAAPRLELAAGYETDGGRLDGLFAAIAACEHDGTDWMRLAGALEQHRQLYLSAPVWADLCAKLLDELVRSTGIAHLRRQVTAEAVLRHPEGGRAMLAAIRDLASTCGAPNLAFATRPLRNVPGHEVNRLFVEMLAAPGALRQAASQIIPVRLARGLFSDSCTDLLLAHLGQLFRGRGRPGIPTQALDIIAALPPGPQAALLARIPAGAQHEARLVLEHGELTSPERARRVTAAICRRIADPQGISVSHDSDPMLASLVHEALFHVHGERRHLASVLLGASPYAHSLPAAVVAAAGELDPGTIGRCLTLVADLRPPSEVVAPVLAWALHHPEARVRGRSLVALSGVATGLPETATQQVVEVARADPDASVRALAVNLLGMAGACSLDALIREGHTSTPVAAWWRRGTPVLEDRPAS
ncbi:hypothetical protein [Marmoricola sp. RAF53]|uniref:hypothetical protein n=1 Tax=Marmoricola sp. RAF53 TaxID=3233059 RepID=UPI003F9520A4